MKVTFTKKYRKSFSKLHKKQKKQAIERIEIFLNNPFEIGLRNHKLYGRYDGYRSINVTGDYRAIFREYPNGTYEFVEFVDIGTHSELY
ncbi:hypothetical protein CSB09_03180 [Candidatus Gracilibacteria bacterium]|nr:MAG: hypothetical protein CSB09_03180 [Candidatus Gracilibacteria bacterium]